MTVSASVTIPERVYEFREWESHHRRWAMGEYEELFEELGKPSLIEFHGGIEPHLANVKAAGMRCVAIPGTHAPERLTLADELAPALDVEAVRRALGT